MSKHVRTISFIVILLVTNSGTALLVSLTYSKKVSVFPADNPTIATGVNEDASQEIEAARHGQGKHRDPDRSIEHVIRSDVPNDDSDPGKPSVNKADVDDSVIPSSPKETISIDEYLSWTSPDIRDLFERHRMSYQALRLARVVSCDDQNVFNLLADALTKNTAGESTERNEAMKQYFLETNRYPDKNNIPADIVIGIKKRLKEIQLNYKNRLNDDLQRLLTPEQYKKYLND